MNRLIGIVSGRRLRQIRPRHGQTEQQHTGGSQSQQQQIAQLQNFSVPLNGFSQEVHRRPIDDPKPPPVEQMNNHRPRRGYRSGNGKRYCIKT